MRAYPLLRRFDPRVDGLPHAQRDLWPRLAELPEDAVLYGGTAIAIRLAHRVSVDFDRASRMAPSVPLDDLYLCP